MIIISVLQTNNHYAENLQRNDNLSYFANCLFISHTKNWKMNDLGNITMTATILVMLSKFLVFMGKLMTVMMKTWHHTFTTMTQTWHQIGSQLYTLVHYGMHNMLASLK